MMEMMMGGGGEMDMEMGMDMDMMDMMDKVDSLCLEKVPQIINKLPVLLL